MARLINFLLSQRYMLAVLAILLGGAISLGALKTTIDSSDDSILSEDDPYRLEVAQVNKDFPPSTSVLFAFMSPEGDVFNRDMLQAMQDLTDRYTDVESAVSVASLINHRLNAVNADIHRRDYLLPELDELTAQDLVKIREIALTVLGLMYFCLGSLSFALAIAAVSVMSVGLTVGAVGWAQVPFNQISNMGPLVVFMIAMADSIHLVSVYLQGLHKSLSKFEALRESLRVNIQPVTLATVTTAMGFLSLNYCASPGIYGFGNVVAIGVVWAFLVTFTLLPALILLLPVKKVPKPLGVKGFINFVANVVANHGTPLFWGSLTLIAVTFAMLPLNKVDFDRFSFIDKDSDFHTVISALAEKIGNDQSLVYSIDSGKYYGITEPEFLRKIEEFSLWLEEQPQTSFVTSYTGFLKNRNMAENDNDPAWEVLPEDNLQIIDYLVGYQLVQEIEPQLEPIFNADYSAIRLVVGTSNLSNVQLLDFSEQIEDWITLNMDPAYDVLHGDNSILYARLNKTISLQLMEGFTVSFLLITATLLVGLKSVRYGLLSIIPNLFPATIVFGIWGLLVGELSPYILMLFSISIGLVVDDSVHVLSKYIVARREGNSPEAAVQYSLDRAGSAITITTLSLAIGTFILVLSNTFYYQNVALLLTPIIITALLLDLLFLPPLLVRFDNWLERRKPSTV